MIEAGAVGVRQTFSFGTLEFQSKRATAVKAAAKGLAKEVIVLADLPGEKPRLGTFTYKGDSSFLVETQEVIAIALGSEGAGDSKTLCINHDELFTSLEAGQTLIVGDGTVSFLLVEKDGTLAAEALNAGSVENNRGVSVVGGSFIPKALTEYDLDALAHVAKDDNFDAVAISFVQSAAELETARSILGDSGKVLIAKIETSEGVANAKEIAAAADQVMIARGDLALTMPWAEMPAAVDRIVEACAATKTPYLVATQVAETMATQPMMSRAEMCDLWQWKKRGAEAVILCRETGWGERPVETVGAVKSLLDHQ